MEGGDGDGDGVGGGGGVETRQRLRAVYYGDSSSTKCGGSGEDGDSRSTESIDKGCPILVSVIKGCCCCCLGVTIT